MIGHHCAFADLQRWIAEVPGDPSLAVAAGEIEKAVQAGTASTAEARA